MATITIGPTGDFQYANAAAYSALAGGATENIVNWQAGFTYTPDPASGKWWGRDGRDGMDKRIVNQIVGGGTNPFVLLTAMVWIDENTTAVWDVPSGCWKIQLISNSAAIALSSSDDVFFHTRFSSSAAGVEIGWRQPPAKTLADVGPDGQTQAGQNAGKGVWFSTKVGNDVFLYVWCPNGQSQHPAAQWGGIACNLQVGGAGQPGTTPKTSPFTFLSTGSNDPSGSQVLGDFRLYGASAVVAAGIPVEDRASPTLVYGDLIYEGIRIFGRQRFALAGSTAANGAGNTGYVHDVILRGDWEIDDRVDPDIFQCTTNSAVLGGFQNDGRFENINIESRIRNALIEGGRITVGLTHGVLSIVPTQTSLFTGVGDEDARTVGTVIRNVSIRGRRSSPGIPVGIRAFAIRAVYDTVLEGCDFIGMSTPSKINGKNTLVYGNTVRLTQFSDEEPSVSPSTSEGESCFTVTAMGTATEDTNLSVRLYCNIFDRRGDTSRGVNEPYAGFELRAFGGDSIPAGALNAQCNIVLSDPDEPASCAVRIKTHGDGVVDRNQTLIGNWHTHGEAREALEGTFTAGAVKTFAQLFDTGYAAGQVSGNLNDTAENIMHRRGDRPANLALSVGVAG